jgi:hypothetical protein
MGDDAALMLAGAFVHLQVSFVSLLCISAKTNIIVSSGSISE